MALSVALSGLAPASASASEGTPRTLEQWRAPLEQALAKTGQMPQGFRLTVSRATAGDKHLLAGKRPRVELGRKTWTGPALTVRASSIVDGRRRSGWVRFKIEVSAPVAVARMRIVAGQRLKAADFKTVVRRVKARNGVFGTTTGLNQRVARRAFAKGQVVYERWLVPIGGIRRGDRVDATWTRGGLTLRFAVEALQPGRVGQSIPVRVVSTGKAVRARINAPGHLEVLQ